MPEPDGLAELRRQLAYDIECLRLGLPEGPVPAGFLPGTDPQLLTRLESFIEAVVLRESPRGSHRKVRELQRRRLGSEAASSEAVLADDKAARRNASMIQSGVFAKAPDQSILRGLALVGVGTRFDEASAAGSLSGSPEWESF